MSEAKECVEDGVLVESTTTYHYVVENGTELVVSSITDTATFRVYDEANEEWREVNWKVNMEARKLTRELIRQELISYLTKLDPLGCYSDECSRENGVNIMSLNEAITHTAEAILLYERWMTANHHL